MSETAKQVEDEPVEEHVSPPKKAKTKENKITTTSKLTANQIANAASNRLPRAAKTRAAARANGNVEQNNNNVEPKKARAKKLLRRSNSSDSLASVAIASLKKSRITKSAEDLAQPEAPTGKKTKNATLKGAKKTVPKKAGNDAKLRKKATREASMEASDEDAADEARAPMIAKKSYARGATKKAASVGDTKEDDEKPKKRIVAKKAASGAKATRGRGKASSRENSEEADVADVAEDAKPKKSRATLKKATAVVEEDENVETDEKDAESVNVEEAAPDAAQAKRGKKIAATTKRPRAK